SCSNWLGPKAPDSAWRFHLSILRVELRPSQTPNLRLEDDDPGAFPPSRCHRVSPWPEPHQPIHYNCRADFSGHGDPWTYWMKRVKRIHRDTYVSTIENHIGA